MKYFITGGTGTLGKEIVSQIYDNAERIVVYSRDEAKQAQMKSLYQDRGIMRYFIGDVRDYDRLKIAMRGCDTVIHTAALKRIEVCEYNIFEAIRTNVNGSENVVKASIENNIKKSVLISTDKACSPCSTYGITKNLAEKIFINGNNYGDGCFYCVRYGNVEGSRGAVHNIWKQAAAEGRDLLVTDENMTRWFWSIKEAASFVLSSLSYAHRGCIYVPEMKSYKMIDIAKSFSDKIKVTGMRCPEKLHEQMITETEAFTAYKQSGRYAIYPVLPDFKMDDGSPKGSKVEPGFTLTSEVKNDTKKSKKH